MRREITTFDDGSKLYFDRGLFDDWCVWYEDKRGNRMAPSDTDYFKRLKTLSLEHGATKIYNDFVSLYNSTRDLVESSVLQLISRLSGNYEGDKATMEKLFCILYAGMIAEENKKHAKLRKRIKRLGVHQVLIEGMAPQLAASFSKGKPWQELDSICAQKGF